MTDILPAFHDVQPAGDGWTARCPAHEDRHSSLSITRTDARWLLHCHVGCTFKAVVAAAGLSAADLFAERTTAAKPRIVAAYDYRDEGGAVLYQVCRMEPKDFRQRRPNGTGWTWKLGTVRRVLYRLPELHGQRTVYAPEGEKDADRLAALGLPATTNAGGAGKWRPEYTAQLKAAGAEQMIILPDHDAPGLKHAHDVAASCHVAGIAAHIVALPGLPAKGDVSDWLTAGHTAEELQALVAAAPVYTGEPIRTPRVLAPTSAPRTLAETIATFRRWLSLEDPSSVMAVAAALVANRALGDPVWLLLVCAPSTGKTEILSAAGGLPWVISAAKVTEASLLSGTSRKEKAKDATGGLLCQIGDFGVLLCKDFTSVLAQNKDASAEAMAALREVYDGDWHRPVGTDGGKVLMWRGKCGLVGGVTPALDQYTGVLTALGDRFVLLRMPDADVDDFGAAALRHGDHERQMRQELRAALAGLVEHADTSRVNRTLTDDEGRRIIRLAAYTARARTAVSRDSHHDVLYLPQVEGPGRLVKAYARLLGGLEAIGCDGPAAWEMLTRIAIDCVPALRTRFIRALLAHEGPARTSDIATAAGTVAQDRPSVLEDLSLLKLVDQRKLTAADNSPDLWTATAWLRQHFPPLESGTNKYPPAPQTLSTSPHEAESGTGSPGTVGRGVFDGPTLEGATDVRF